MNNKTESPIDPQGQVLMDCLHRLGEKPGEAYNTVQAVRSMSADNIIHEIRTWGTAVDSKIGVQNVKIDALNAKVESQNAKIDSQNAKIDSQNESQNAKIESLRWMIGVLIALLTLLAILGFITFSGHAAPVADPCVHAASTEAAAPTEAPAAAPAVPTAGSANAVADIDPTRPPAQAESHQVLGAPPQEDSLE